MHVFQSLSWTFPRRRFLLLSLGMALLLWSGLSLAQGFPKPQMLPLTPLVIETADGSHSFEVMVAKNRRQRAKGLMYRRQMDDDHGMLFNSGRTHKISMWMKNTYISLDMIFIRRDGTIANIAADNQPHSLASVPSDGRVAASLELVGGTAERLGIKSGDLVRHAMFDNLEPAP